MIHAVERARERYGLELTERDLRRIVRRIRNRQPEDRRVKLVSREKGTFDICYRGCWIRVAMAADMQKVMTMQPRPGAFRLGDVMNR